jgi:hypothetical protein
MKEKKAQIVFQLLIVQLDLPGQRQNGLAYGDCQFAPSQGKAAVTFSVRRSYGAPFSSLLPYSGCAAGHSYWNCFVLIGIFFLKATHSQVSASGRVC